MIVLFGYGDDPCLHSVSRSAEDLGVPVVLVDQRLGADCGLVVTMDRGHATGRVTIAGSSVDLDDVMGVYARPLSPVALHDERGNERSHMLRAAFVEWLDLTDAQVVNPPSAMLSNASKPFQIQLIAAAGFSVPETLVTNDPEQAQDFHDEHGEVIFKSTSGIRSVVRRLDPTACRRLDQLRHLPTQFQEYVEGVDVRVHVVRDQIFATEIRSDAVDYRYARADGLVVNLEGVSLPEEIAERCTRLASALSLPFCGIDLRRRIDGTYVCFEVNPMPGFTYYEAHTGQPIGRAVSQLLAQKA